MMYTPSVVYKKGILKIVDQTLLPGRLKYVELKYLDDTIDAIKKLKVRGAPAIGIVGAYALSIYAKKLNGISSHIQFKEKMNQAADFLFKSRPTAVNLEWALNRIKKIYSDCSEQSLTSLYEQIESEAIKIHCEDADSCRRIGLLGLDILPVPCNVLTHCNTGSLATGGWGTALGLVYAAHEKNIPLHVYVTETRPLGQGARLTFWELMHNNIPCTLITDSMAGMLMKQEKVNLVLFGADRIAANGDLANKIGTYSLTALANYHKIPCYAVAPLTTFDIGIDSGGKIPIEHRNGDEILAFYKYPDSLPETATVYNPAFDVTPGNLLTGIITEKGILRQPIKKSIKQLFT